MMPLQRPRMITITMARYEFGTSVVLSVLLMLVIALLSAACASARPNRATLLQFTSPLRSAGPISGSWDKVEGLRVGSPLVVTLKSGDRFEGALKGLTRGGLTLTAPSGQEFEVPRSEVGRIVAKAKDGLTNGGLIWSGRRPGRSGGRVGDRWLARRLSSSVGEMGSLFAAVGCWEPRRDARRPSAQKTATRLRCAVGGVGQQTSGERCSI
jgi:hypothetical protein